MGSLHMEISIFFLFLSSVVNMLHSVSIVDANARILLTLNGIFDEGKGWVTKVDRTCLFVLKTRTWRSLTLEIMKMCFVHGFTLLCTSKLLSLRLVFGL